MSNWLKPISNKRIDLTQFEKHHIDEKYGEYFCDLCSCNRSGDEGNPPSLGRVVISACSCVRNTVGAIDVQPLIAELKRCYEVMNEVILRAMDAREEEASDIIKHGDEEYVHVDEITYPFSKSDIDAALDSKASE